MIDRVGTVNDRLIQNRRVMLASSGLLSAAVTSCGSSAMPQIGETWPKAGRFCMCKLKPSVCV
jgi:hypothetical protein